MKLGYFIGKYFTFVDKNFFRRPQLRQTLTRFLFGSKCYDVRMLGADFTLHSVKENGYLIASSACRFSHLLRDEVPTLMNIASLLKDGDTFVDIGANVGVYSLTLYNVCRLKKDLRFYAFEANPDTFDRLERQTKKTSIRAANIAISDFQGHLNFVPGAVSHVFAVDSHTSDYSLAGNSTSVNCNRLDQLEVEGTSLFLKIDVEGHELQVLKGAQLLFEKKLIRALLIDGYADPDVESFLRSYGFRFYDGKSLLPVTGNVFSLLALID